MNIAILTCYRKDDPNGVALVSFESAEVFAKKGNNVTIVSPGDTTDIQLVQPNLWHYTIKSESRSQINFPKMTSEIVLGLIDYLKKFKTEIIHIHCPVELSIIIQAWAISQKIPFLVTAHSLPTQMGLWLKTDSIAEVLKPVLDSTIKSYLQTVYQNCSAVIAPNKTTALDVEDLGFTGDVYVIPNALKDEMFGTIAPTINPLNSTKTLIYTGSINARKNQSYLLNVMKYLPDNYKLYLIGGTPDLKYLKKLRRKIDKENISNVEITGSYTINKIAKMLEKTVVFVSGSTAEVQSRVILEALSSGTPVVGLENATTEEFIDDEVGFLLPVDTSPEVFAQKIRQIAELPQDKYLEMCNICKERVKHFDWDNISKIMLETYKKEIKSASQKYEKKRNLEKLMNLIPEGELRTTINKLITKTKPKEDRSTIWRIPLLSFLLAIGTFIVFKILYFVMKGFRKISNEKK